MIAAGLCILLGVVLDILVHGFSGIHAILILCGVFLIVINSIGGTKFSGKKYGKSVLSLAALAFTCLFLSGFIPLFSSGMAETFAGEIETAGQMAEKKGAVEAAAYIDEIIQKGPWDRDLAFAAAENFRKYGKFNDSTARYIAILSYVPYDIQVRYALAQSMLGAKDYSHAIEQLAYILQLDPQNADAGEALGDCYWANGDNIRGIYYYKMAANQAADSVEKRVKLAQAYANMHSDTEAMTEYRKAKDLAKTFDEEMMVYNGYTSMKGASSTEDTSENKEAGQ